MSFRAAEEFLASKPRVMIVEKSESYIHAEAASRLMHFIDDLEIRAFPERSLLQIRSESRVGIADMGVNQMRIKELIYAIGLNQ